MSDKAKPQDQDRDDGLVFFHTHSVWEAIMELEKFYECKIYGVLELQEVEEHLKMYDEKYSSISKQMILEGIEYAYNKVESCWEYELYLDHVQDYVDTHTALAEDDAYD